MGKRRRPSASDAYSRPDEAWRQKLVAGWALISSLERPKSEFYDDEITKPVVGRATKRDQGRDRSVSLGAYDLIRTKMNEWLKDDPRWTPLAAPPLRPVQGDSAGEWAALGRRLFELAPAVFAEYLATVRAAVEEAEEAKAKREERIRKLTSLGTSGDDHPIVDDVRITAIQRGTPDVPPRSDRGGPYDAGHGQEDQGRVDPPRQHPRRHRPR